MANSLLPKEHLKGANDQFVKNARLLGKLPCGRKPRIIPLKPTEVDDNAIEQARSRQPAIRHEEDDEVDENAMALQQWNAAHEVDEDAIALQLWNVVLGAIEKKMHESEDEDELDVPQVVWECCEEMFACMSGMVHDFLTVVRQRAEQKTVMKQTVLREWVIRQLSKVLDKEWPLGYTFESFVEEVDWRTTHFLVFQDLGQVIERTWNNLLMAHNIQDFIDTANAWAEKTGLPFSGHWALFASVWKTSFSDFFDDDTDDELPQKKHDELDLQIAMAECNRLVHQVSVTLGMYDGWFTNRTFIRAAEIQMGLKGSLLKIKEFGGGGDCGVRPVSTDVGLSEVPLPTTTVAEKKGNCIDIPTSMVKSDGEMKLVSELTKNFTSFEYFKFVRKCKWLAHNKGKGDAFVPFLLDNARDQAYKLTTEEDKAARDSLINHMDAVMQLGKTKSKLKATFTNSERNACMVGCNLAEDGSIEFEWNDAVLKSASEAAKQTGLTNDRRYINPVCILPKLRYNKSEDWEDNILSTWHALEASFDFCEDKEKEPMHYSVFVFAENDYADELYMRLMKNKELDKRLFVIKLPTSSLEDELTGVTLAPGFVWTLAMMFAEAFADYDTEVNTGFQSKYHMMYGDMESFHEFRQRLGARPRSLPHKGAACRALAYSQKVLSKEAFSTEGARERLGECVSKDQFLDNLDDKRKHLNIPRSEYQAILKQLESEEFIAWPHKLLKKLMSIDPDSAEKVKIALWNGRQDNVSQVALSDDKENTTFYRDLQGSAEGISFYKVCQVRYRAVMMNAVAMRGLHFVCDEAMRPSTNLPKVCREAIVSFTAGSRGLRELDPTKYEHLCFKGVAGRVAYLDFGNCKKHVLFAFMVAFMYGHGQWDAAHIMYQMLLNKSGYTVFGFSYQRKDPDKSPAKKGYEANSPIDMDHKVSDNILDLDWPNIHTPQDMVNQMRVKAAADKAAADKAAAEKAPATCTEGQSAEDEDDDEEELLVEDEVDGRGNTGRKNRKRMRRKSDIECDG